MATQPPSDVDRVNLELAQVKEALRSPKVGLIASRRLYNRLGQLYRELDRLTKDIPENEHAH